MLCQLTGEGFAALAASVPGVEPRVIRRVAEPMSELMTVLVVALLPAGGSAAGALLAELWRTPRWVLGAALHAAVGVAMGLVSFELIPRAIETTPVWVIALLFGVGAGLSVLLSRTVEWMRGPADESSRGQWKVYATNGADLLSDGLMTGAGFAVSSGLGMLLALSQVVANAPGGFATGANFRHRGLGRSKRVFAALSYAIPAVVGAALGYLLLRGASSGAQEAALAVIAGVLLVAVVEDLVPQADRPGTARWISTSAFVLGFVFIALLTSYV